VVKISDKHGSSLNIKDSFAAGFNLLKSGVIDGKRLLRGTWESAWCFGTGASFAVTV